VQQPAPQSLDDTRAILSGQSSSVASGANAGAQDTQSTVPATRTGNMFGRILRGALMGLAEGGIPGAVAGGIDPNRAKAVYDAQGAKINAAKQTAQMEPQLLGARIKLANVEAAKSVAEAYHTNQLIDAFPQSVQQTMEDHQMKVGDFLIGLGFTPTVFPMTTEGAQAHLENQTAAQGAVPSQTVLHFPSSGLNISFTGNANSLGSQLGFIQDVQRVMGTPDAGLMNSTQWAKLTPAQRDNVARNAMTTFTPEDLSPDRLPIEIAKRQQYLSNIDSILKKDPSSTVAQYREPIQSAINILKSAQSGHIQTQLQAKQGEAAISDQFKQIDEQRKLAAPGNMFFGSTSDGTQVAGTLEELQQSGAVGISKLPSDESKKVIVARQMISPGGLFQQVGGEIAAIQARDKATGGNSLDGIANHWSDFMAGKYATDPQFAALRTSMGLLSTALMQAHVGARGSHEMLEHFKELADYRVSNAQTLGSALAAEYRYVHEKAMLPKQAPQAAQNGGK